ncbi:MAG TPA: HAD-IA family hydrolase [Roseiflexaceae bacterium]|nr:HAD-IA family hydrolase [Roseiflexaceae bacterium]
METVRAILFDFMGVLLFPRLDYQADSLLDAIDTRMGQVTDDEQFKLLIQQRYQLSDDAFHEVVRRIAAKYVPFRPLWERLPLLRRSFRLAVINNGTYWTIPVFQERLDLTSMFDAFISSAREGISKPDPEIYHRAAHRLGVHPQECLFMDDSQRNIAGAQAAGMRTLHWPSAEEGWLAFQHWCAQQALDCNWPVQY